MKVATEFIRISETEYFLYIAINIIISLCLSYLTYIQLSTEMIKETLIYLKYIGYINILS